MWRILAGTAAAALALLWAQGFATGPRVETFVSRVDDSEQPYALYVPPGFDPARKYPLVISLHAEESNAEIGLMRIFGQSSRIADGSLAPFRLFHPRDVDFLVASPLARGTMGYEGIAERDVYDALADVERRYPVDEDRIYLTGVSMGGGGALRLALTRPDVWAAVAVVCGDVAPGLESLAGNALNLPVRLFHGEQDPLAPAESSRQWQRRLLDAGAPAEYFEYPLVRHNAWDYAYRGGAIFDWFYGKRRQRFPDHVHFTTDSYKYRSAYWVRIDGLTPGTAAWIDARQTAGEARVETRNVDGFTIAPDHAVTAVTIDGTTLRLPKAASLSFRKVDGRWQRGLFARAGKGPGSEGPMTEAVSGRHLYVYGTAGTSSSEEMDERRKAAETAAEWSTERERLRLKLPVKADLDVTEGDIATSDLVLFGTRETNSVIARFADRLPLALSPGAADYGLVFLAPAGSHYVLVNSGLPFWTGWEDGRGGDHYAPWQYRELSGLGDFVVFKGSMAHVVASGRFDSSWKVPADLAAKMTATGTIAVR